MSWSRLSDIGQAYGTLAAALTALTLGAVAVSVLLQARDARTAQEHGTRMLHLELVQIGLRRRAEPLIVGGVIGAVAGCALTRPRMRRRRAP